MKRSTVIIAILLTVLCHTPTLASNQNNEKTTTIAQRTVGMEKQEGFFNYYWDDKEGKLWLEIDKWDKELLYVVSLPAGVGSNDIGLDRAQLGGTYLVVFQRVGPKVLMIEKNYGFRAISENPAERRAVRDAFALSTIWGFNVESEEEARVLVDASDFFLRDAHNVGQRLKNMKQGTYKLDPSRSAFYPPQIKNFPKNSEIEVTLTFTGEPEGQFVRQVVPTPDAITVRQHHSFIQLPEDDYKLRTFDPRAGFFGISYMDFSTPIDDPITKRFISRHRLKKKYPNEPMSEPESPIIYYIDPGIPEPILSAVFKGAQWWNEAFESAGYIDAFQVKLLPEGADPMDIRYNVVNWIHRATRGWSYGSSVRDPRTGEILKGHVILGSLRLRQDYLIAEGLLAPYEEGKPVSSAMKEIALDRLRQLVAHEIGHTLGLAHNYVASTRDRASVMDYPHPMMKINDDGTLDWSDAYDTGVSEWDKIAITYGYRNFPDGIDEKTTLIQILEEGWDRGLIFISDQDARPLGGAHPQAHLWDNGMNAVDQLNHIMKVRALALERFSNNNIKDGAPMATLEEVLVPLYLHHRYQLEATSKVLGGLNYTYAARGDGQLITEIVSPEEQRRALKALLSTIQPETLTLPERILKIVPPRSFGYPRSRETFNAHTGVTFDPLAAAEAASNLTIRVIFHSERAARLVEYHARNSRNPGLSEVVDKVLHATWKSARKDGLRGEIQRVAENVVLYHLMALAVNESATQQSRAIASLKLDELKVWLEGKVRRIKDDNLKAHYLFAISRIEQFQKDPSNITIQQPVDPPAGSPIGVGDDWCGWNNQ